MSSIIGYRLNRQQGLTLVELLIAMLIAIIAMLAISQVLVVNSSYQRSTVGTSDAQTTGALALHTLETDGRMAGFGLASSSLLGCGQIRYQFNGTSPTPVLTVAPVEIIAGTGNGPDTITFMMASHAERVIPASTRLAMSGADADLDMFDVLGFNTGDIFLISDSTNLSSGTHGCTLMQVSAVNLTTSRIEHDTSSDFPYNPSGGFTGIMYPKDSLVFNLGQPSVKRYAIASNSLQVTSYFSTDAATSKPLFDPTARVLYEQIVNMQAEYGKDNNDDGIVDTYNKTPPVTSTDWIQVLTIRLGLLVRSKDQEKPVNGVCEATTALPTWTGGTFSIPGGVPSCFKYRVYETIIPMRNMIWRES